MDKQKVIILIGVLPVVVAVAVILGSFIYHNTRTNTSNLADDRLPIVPRYPNIVDVQPIASSNYDIAESYISSDDEATVLNWYIREATAAGWTFFGQNDTDQAYHRVSFSADNDCYFFRLFITKTTDGWTLYANQAVKRNCTYGKRP